MTVRAVIGDELRMPIMWCEMGSCISWHADPAALGEADTRARAIGSGWRIDAFGRLACPRCQQIDPGFWATGPVVPWDRYTAVARAARAAVRSEGTVGATAWGSSRDPGGAPAALLLPGRQSRDGTSEHLRSRGGGPEGVPRLAPVSVSHRD